MDLTFAKRLDGMSGSAIRDIFKLLTKPSIISFAGGNPAASSFEPEYIAELTKQVLDKNGVNILQYGQTEGYAPLRESAAEFFKHNGVNADPSQILPVTGSQQTLDLVCKAMIDPGDVMLVESPTFLGALQTFRTYQAKCVDIRTDEDGVDLNDLEEKMKTLHPKLVYLIPTFQNPTGRTLSLERRKKVAQLAAKYRTLVIEDDPYRDLRYKGEPLPAIKSFDEEGWILYSNSFSKIISPGMRVAALVASDPTLMRKLVICKQAVDVHSPNLNQAIIDAYLRSGKLMQHISNICASYAKQMQAMQKMLATFPKSVNYTKPDGGIFLWCELPEGFNTTELLQIATAERGVAYIPGTHFYPTAGTHHNTMRLNFSNASVEKIEEGMGRLRDLFLSQGLQ